MNKEELKRYVVSAETKLVDAMKKINENGNSTVFVLDDEGKLIGSLSDGDIRRWIISKGELDTCISSMMNKSPKYLYQDYEIDPIDFIQSKKIRVLPILDDCNVLVDLVTGASLCEKKQIKNDALKDIPVVIMAGGKGTRLQPFTNVLPKPLIPIDNLTIIEHIINNFKRFGCIKFYLIVNYKKNLIKSYFNEIEKDYEVNFIEENTYLGTGGGISLLKDIINKTFILTNCDTIIQEDFSKILKEHTLKNNLITMICCSKKFEVPYGVIEINRDNSIKEFKEKPNLPYIINTGSYIVEKETIDLVKKNVKIDFPDIIVNAKNNGYKVGTYVVDNDDWLDMGQFDSLEETKGKLKL